MRDHLVTAVVSAAVTFGLMKTDAERPRELDVDRLIVRKELIVSDTGQPWEKGYEEHQIARGIYARSVGDDVGGLWVRSRLIKGEIGDPFDDRFHALETDGSLRRARDTSRGTSGSTALGGKWPSSRARGSSFPKCRGTSGTAQHIPAASACKRFAPDIKSR